MNQTAHKTDLQPRTNYVRFYPSPYLVLTKNEYTKHYYAGADRVAACLGGGEMDLSMTWDDSYTSRLDPQDVQVVSDKLFEQSMKQVGGRVLEPNDLDCIKEIFKGEFDKELHNPIDGIPNRMRANVGFKYYDFHKKVEELRHYQHDEGKYVYYYHSDHLGSASWITDHDGNPVQHLQYLPYGEPYVDQRTIGYSERFRFHRKEKDYESGFHYFGARYYRSELLTSWLSVDPLVDKYPSISPYNYCAWNPVKLVDPDGREWDPSALTQEQQNKLNNSVATLCERSPMFKEVYNTLTESDVVYKLQMGPTLLDPAQYDNSDNSITFRDEAALESYSAFVEEMVHAYQLSENKNEYSATLDFNYEFEAKLIKALMLDGAMQPPGGMDDILRMLINDYNGGTDLDYSQSSSPTFRCDYMRNANEYANYNKTYNIGNENYQKYTHQAPASLNLLLKKVRP